MRPWRCVYVVRERGQNLKSIASPPNSFTCRSDSECVNVKHAATTNCATNPGRRCTDESQSQHLKRAKHTKVCSMFGDGSCGAGARKMLEVCLESTSSRWLSCCWRPMRHGEESSDSSGGLERRMCRSPRQRTHSDGLSLSERGPSWIDHSRITRLITAVSQERPIKKRTDTPDIVMK